MYSSHPNTDYTVWIYFLNVKINLDWVPANTFHSHASAIQTHKPGKQKTKPQNGKEIWKDSWPETAHDRWDGLLEADSTVHAS